MEKIIHNNQLFEYYEFPTEGEFEKYVIQHAKAIFGERTFYINLKKKIKKDNIATIPDGYLLDFTLEHRPRLYIIENELSIHDPSRHIGKQLLEFAISIKGSGRLLKHHLLEYIQASNELFPQIQVLLQKTTYRNIDDFLEKLIFDTPTSAIVVIDKIADDLENVLAQLKINTDIIEFQAFLPINATQENNHKTNHILFKFTPFQSEIRAFTETKTPSQDAEAVDVIIVPAREDGFIEEFLNNSRWFAIRMSSSLAGQLKYIAAYQTSPVSAITHYAEIKQIEKYKDTGKYIVTFKDKAKEVGPLKLMKEDGKIKMLRNVRYTSIDKLLKAKTIDDVF